MCDCEKIDKLNRLKEHYREEASLYETEYELFGNTYLKVNYDDRLKRIEAVEKKLKTLKRCQSCAYQRKIQEQEAKRKEAEEKRDNEQDKRIAENTKYINDLAEAVKHLLKEIQTIDCSIVDTIKEEEA